MKEREILPLTKGERKWGSGMGNRGGKGGQGWGIAEVRGAMVPSQVTAKNSSCSQLKTKCVA
jgi:hypothetical protein